MCYRKPITIKS